jgi:HEPN domain-containing protein
MAALRDPSDPAEWHRRARSNLARARADRGQPEILYEDLCLDAQQASEKALKALLVHRALVVPRTHAIGGLLGIIEQTGLEVPEAVREASILTDYAVQVRYPGRMEDVSREEYLRAVELAESREGRSLGGIAPAAYSACLFELGRGKVGG